MKKNDLIFIVEDDQFYADALESFLQSLGYTNIEMYSSAAACLENKFKMPRMVLLDYNLGDKKGESILLDLISFDSNLPVVFISGQESIQLAVDTLKFGAFDYIQKDTNAFDKLKHIIDRIGATNKSVHNFKRRVIQRRMVFGLLTVCLVTVVIFLSL